VRECVRVCVRGCVREYESVTGTFWQGLLRMFAERGINGCSNVFTTATHADVRTALGRANARVKRLRGEPDEVTPPYPCSCPGRYPYRGTSLIRYPTLVPRS